MLKLEIQAVNATAGDNGGAHEMGSIETGSTITASSNVAAGT